MRRSWTLAALSLLLAAGPANAQDLPDHALFTELLQQVVERPLVDYQALLDRRELLDRYVSELGRTEPSRLEAAPRDERLAF